MDQRPEVLDIYLFHHVCKHQIDGLTFILYRLEDAVQLLGQVLKNRSLFEESIFELMDHAMKLRRIKVKDPHDLDVYGFLFLVGRVVSLREDGTVEEVLVDIADENLNDLVHVEVDYSHSLAP